MLPVILGGCATAGPAPQPPRPAPGATDYVTADRAVTEYRQAAAKLTLAPDWHWPADPEPSTGPDGAPQFYQLHAATNDAQTLWFCSWVDRYSTATRPADRRSALASMRKLTGTYLYTQGSDAPAQALFRTVLKEAENGSVALVRTFDDQNCQPLKR